MTGMADLMCEIESILRRNLSGMYSKEEILNVLAPKKVDKGIERLLAELEVSISLKESKSDVYATCRTEPYITSGTRSSLIPVERLRCSLETNKQKGTSSPFH